MSFILLFYSTGKSKPIQEFISSTEEYAQAKVLRSLDLLEKYGLSIGMPHVKKVEKELFELRVRGKQEVRILFCMRREKLIFLHGFIKKTNKIPIKELKTAKARLTNI
jgi:phage-related protein